MLKQKIYIFHKIPEIGLKMLQAKFEFSKKLKGASAILSLLTDKIDAKTMDKAGKNLKIISNYAVGFDNIDIAAASQRQIMVTNTPGILTNTVAEHTIGLICAIAQRIVEADKFTRKDKFHGWQPMLFLGTDLKNKILGIIGLGRIGQRVAEIAKRGFGMKILYYDKIRNSKYRFNPIKRILKKADFISLHVPLLPSTNHLIGKKELKSMKKTACLINTARGPIVDEKALVKALKNKQIAGAALDVFEKEPKLARGLNKLNNVVLTPHIASASVETRRKMAVIAAQNIIDALENKKPKFLVNEV